MRILYALICEEATNRPDGRLDAHGVFRELHAPGFPAQQDQMVLAVGLEWDQGEEGRHYFKIDLLDPSRSPCLTVDGHSEVTRAPAGAAPPQTRLVMALDNVVFPEAGTYLFELQVDGKATTLAPIHLIQSGVAADARASEQHHVPAKPKDRSPGAETLRKDRLHWSPRSD